MVCSNIHLDNYQPFLDCFSINVLDVKIKCLRKVAHIIIMVKDVQKSKLKRASNKFNRKLY